MSFHISVHLLADDKFFRSPPEGSSSELDAWIEECQRRELYSNPFGFDGQVFKFWHSPAHELGLQLIGRVYNDGLSISGDDLQKLADELRQLERHWLKMNLETESPVKCLVYDPDGTVQEKLIAFKDDLHERANHLLMAINIAQTRNGILTIS